MPPIAGNSMARHNLPEASTGFSMVELMTVLAIASILVALAAPSFSELIRNQRITTATNDFLAAINLTRSEAIKRSTRVDLVPSSADGEWGKGWVVFVDGNLNQKPDAEEEIIFMRDNLPAGMIVESKLKDMAVPYLAYNGTGRTRTNGNPDVPQAGSFLFKLDDRSRKININMLGRARVCNPDTDKTTC
jgi:type IV fimbrial biogenesis protein FimT